MKPNNYDEALQELLELLEKLQAEDMNLQQMREAMTRAAELIQYCRSELRNAQDDMDELLRSLEADT